MLFSVQYHIKILVHYVSIKHYSSALRGVGGGGGWGGSPCFFVVKLDFEIAVDQQIKAHDQTFEGVPDSGCPPVPAGQPRPYLVNFGLNFAKSP